MAYNDPSGNIAAEQPSSSAPTPSLRLLSVDARATPQDFGSQVGGAIEGAGNALDNFSDQMMEISNKRDALYAQQVATKAEVDWRQNMAQAAQAFTLDPSKGVNYADTYKTQFAAYQEQAIAGNPNLTQNAKNLVMSHLNTVGASMFEDALHLQAKASTDWSVQSFQNTAQNLDKIANSEGAWVGYKTDGSLDTTYFDNVREQHMQMTANAQGIVPDAARREENLRFNIQTDKAEIDTVTARFGAGVAAKGIVDGTLGTSLSIPQRQSQIYELQSRQHEDTNQAITDFHKSVQGYVLGVEASGQRDPVAETNLNNKATLAYGSDGVGYAAKAVREAGTAEDKFQAQQQLDQISAQIENKYPTKEAKNNFLKSLSDPNHEITPQEASDSNYLNYLPVMKSGENPIETLDKVRSFQADFNQKVQDGVKINQGTTTLKSASVDDLKAFSDGIDPTSATYVEKGLKKFADARVKAIQNDAFSVTVQDDKPMQSLLQSAQDSAKLDPKISNTASQQAVERSISLQAKLNPDAAPMVMSKNDADFYIGQLKTTTSSDQLSQTLNSMQEKFGPRFQDALSQLHNNPKNPLPSGLSLVAANVNQPNTRDILTAVNIPDGNGQGKEKEKEDNPGYAKRFAETEHPEYEKSIDTLVWNDPTLMKYKEANSVASNKQQDIDQTNSTINAIGKYAKFLYLNPPAGTKYDDNSAVAAAVKSAVSNHIDFGQTNGVNYLINREGKNGTYSDEDTSKIKGQLDKELLDISSKFPTGYESSDKDEPKLGALNNPGQQASLYDIQSRAYWVTTPDMTGVYLAMRPMEGPAASREAIPVPNSLRTFDDMLNKAANTKVDNHDANNIPPRIYGY